MKTIPGIAYAAPPRTAAAGAALAQPPKLVVVHCTSNTASAAAEAHYAATRTDPQSRWTSCHVYVDEHGPLGSLPLDLAAWAAFSWANAHGWHIELCGEENAVPEATQRIGAALVRQLCLLGGIPITHLDGAAIQRLHDSGGPGGVTGHIDITRSRIDGNDHTDPGDRFDWPRFMGWVAEGETPAATTGGDGPMWAKIRDQGTVWRSAGRVRVPAPDGGTAAAWMALLPGREVADEAALTALLGPTSDPDLARLRDQLAAATAADATRDAALTAAIQALTAGGTSVDTAAVLARINTVAAEESSAIQQLQQALAAGAQREAQLRHDLAEALGGGTGSA
jgi:hypothetical protein